MQDIKYRWLPHLEDAVPKAGQGKRISTYNVALEGWRRGLKLTIYSVFDDENKLKIRYTLGLNNKTHYFSLSMGDKISEDAFNVCDDKELTKQFLSKSDVPVPTGKMFESHVDDEAIIAYAESLGFPLVVKPTNGNAGKGVFANIQNTDDLSGILEHVRRELNYPEIIIESYVAGEEFRIYVIEDKVIGAMNRRPANVVGDGLHSIKQLIDIKNEIRKINPHLTNRLIKVDREVTDLISRVKYNLNSVPKKGELLLLREKSNLSAGGDAIDVTDELTSELKSIAINAGKAIPGLAHYGVDMIVDKENNTGVILEVNARPGIGGHLFPMKGKPRDFAKEIIDYYFPETAETERSMLYFDFDSILEPIKKRSATKVEVSPPPMGKLYGKKYTVYGDVQKVGYRNWIKRQALSQGLHGYTENMEDGSVVVVVVSTDLKQVDEFRDVCVQGSEKSKVSEVVEVNWDKPVQIGFEAKRDYKLSAKEIKELEMEKEKIKKDREYIKKKYSQIRNSRAWRITYPVRFTLYNIKKAFRSANKSNEN